MPSLHEVAQAIGAELSGDGTLTVSRVAPLDRAREGELSFLANPKYAPQLPRTLATAVIVAPDVSCPGKALLKARDPYLAFAKAVAFLHPTPAPSFSGVHATAVVAEGASVARSAVLMPYVVVDRGASVSERCVLYPHVYVGERSRIGEESRIYPFVSIREDVTIGARVLVHSGTVIGSDGFGFAPEGTGYRKIPQIGGVEIGDDVEIGAACTVDRGALSPTRIGRGTKLDNQVHVAHNVQVGEDCLLVAQVAISGSVQVGNHVTLGGKTGVAGHLTIGDGAQAGAMSGIGQDVAPGEQVFGAPSNPLPLQMRINAALKRLPDLLARVRHLERRLAELESGSARGTKGP